MLSRGFARIAIFLLLSCSFLAAGAIAQSSAPAPDPARVQAAREMFAAQGGVDQARKSLDEITKSIIEQARQSSPDIADGLERFLKDYFSSEKGHVKALLDDVLDISARYYAERFTVEEMQQLTNFLRSPVGQKFVEAAPGVTAAATPRLIEFQQRMMMSLQMAMNRGDLHKKN